MSAPCLLDLLADRVRDVIHNFNADGFDSIYPRYRPAFRVIPVR